MTLNELIERVSANGALPVLDGEGVAEFLRRQEFGALCFFNDPKVYPENFDLAVILPELLKGFPNLRAAVADPAQVNALARDYGVAVYPALVLFKDGEPRDVVARIQAWSEYRERIGGLFL